MPFVLPPYNDLVNPPETTFKKIYENNIQYEPIYNNIYNIKPRIIEETDEERKEENVSIMALPLETIFKNIANTLLLILIDLTKVKTWSNLTNFLSIFLIENRLLYFGIFVIILSLYFLLFFN
jgi:hypothetical protein